MNDPQHEFDDELLSAYLDDQLTSDERAVVESRLAGDASAARMLEELRAVQRAVQSLPAVSVGEDLRASVLRQADHSRRVELGAAVSQSLDAEEDSSSQLTIGRSTRGWVWAAVTLAAALLLMIYQGSQPGREVARRSGEAELRKAPSSSALEGDARAAHEDEVWEGPPGDTASGVERLTESARADRAVSASPDLVVQVSMPPDAWQNRSFDRLLASHGIQVDPSLPDLAAQQSVAVRQNRRRSGAAKLREQLAVPELETGDADVLLVEASVPQVQACLVELQQDRTNYAAVEVQSPGTLGGYAGRVAAADRLGRAGESVAWQEYARGTIPTAQRAQLNAYRDMALDRQIPPRPQVRESPAVAASAPPTAARSRAAQPLSGDLPGPARNAEFDATATEGAGRDGIASGSKSARPPMQVLFVLVPDRNSREQLQPLSPPVEKKVRVFDPPAGKPPG